MLQRRLVETPGRSEAHSLQSCKNGCRPRAELPEQDRLLWSASCVGVQGACGPSPGCQCSAPACTLRQPLPGVCVAIAPPARGIVVRVLTRFLPLPLHDRRDAAVSKDSSVRLIKTGSKKFTKKQRPAHKGGDAAAWRGLDFARRSLPFAHAASCLYRLHARAFSPSNTVLTFQSRGKSGPARTP